MSQRRAAVAIERGRAHRDGMWFVRALLIAFTLLPAAIAAAQPEAGAPADNVHPAQSGTSTAPQSRSGRPKSGAAHHRRGGHRAGGGGAVIDVNRPTSPFDCDLPIGIDWYGSREACLAYQCEGANVYNEYFFDAANQRRRNPCYGQSPTEFPGD